ncbi:TM2 domain-containing protein [Candidatus Planktophila dulcis]|jgi:hypothetical protein|uniref:TM2 domain-containing protein n=1 Tax=Candidatus Planktophila dulcis TaxID=1884914 RepID=UPI001CBB86F9|nr:TM2 domain-containing protein [Candidatus Planktophila dulcis]
MNFLISKTFLAILAGLSIFRFASMAFGSFGVGYSYEVTWLLVMLTAITQTVMLFGIIVRHSNIKVRENGIRIAFLVGVVGVFVIAASDYFDRRGRGIPLNPLELAFPIISTIFPVLNFYHIPLFGFPLFGFWVSELILFYGLFVLAFLITFKNKGNNQVLVPHNFNNPPTNESNVRQAMNNVSNWTVRIPGQPENPVDTTTLQNWAKSGFVRPDTMVTEVATGYAYQARQIPGIFSAKSYVTALLLSFFFGVFGVDRFYLGHVGVGLGKLFTFGGLGIWALIDFILIATKNVKDGQGVPLA